jgi:hypothetical protein
MARVREKPSVEKSHVPPAPMGALHHIDHLVVEEEGFHRDRVLDQGSEERGVSALDMEQAS